MRHYLATLITINICMVFVFFIALIIWEPEFKRLSARFHHPTMLDISTTITPNVIRESVTLHDTAFTYQLNMSTFQAEFPFLQNYKCSLKLSPRKVPEEVVSMKLLILAIKSHPSSGSRRDALRRTWANEREINGYKTWPLFLLANTQVVGHMELVKYENQMFGDILQWDFNEEHHNLSLKEHCFLEWLNNWLPGVAFVFKGDDDIYVNPHGLVQYIEEHGCSPRTLHGALQRHSVAMRYGKYKVSVDLFPNPKYPYFLSGGGFLIPGQAVGPLYAASRRLPVFPLDDVYLGFMAAAANLTFRNEDEFHVFGLKYEVCVFKRALVVHGIGPEELIRIWTEVKSATCTGKR
ncbi:hypothetical protein GDO86_019340 [Hymenochirus boettgeri]|uniref:Hexosyltransferase n=1 Tax=Hymenochirus boettgeri TaxID=247094 RepID=A0A8T2IGP4_9PIPI|nr:hypothetical protein GDO86_019340 [Hymenochirus boettgeri]